MEKFSENKSKNSAYTEGSLFLKRPKKTAQYTTASSHSPKTINPIFNHLSSNRSQYTSLLPFSPLSLLRIC
jgi:hypothetical protein